MRKKDLKPTREWLRANKGPVFSGITEVNIAPGGLLVNNNPLFSRNRFQRDIVRKKSIVFLTVYCLTIFTGCSGKGINEPSPENTPISNSAADIRQETEERPEMRKRIIVDNGNLMVMSGEENEPYTYDEFPDIPRKVAGIINMLDDGDNSVNSYNKDEQLYVCYVLDDSRSIMLGGNDVDIFNFCIDKEQDIIEFSVENLTFPDTDEDYRYQLLETFRMLFDENGEAIHQYFIDFYENPDDVMEDETIINGMQIKYRCTPKHRLKVFLTPTASSTPSLPGQSLENEFSLIIGEKYITLNDWDYEADISGVLGKPLQETERILGDEADTHAGSIVKTQEFEGLVLYLFTPNKYRGFWISRMVVTDDKYKTYRGISVGCSRDQFKEIYPEANMALDGRTDPNNCAYTFYQGDQYIKFEFKDGVIKKIEYYVEIP